jgi:hypothetical protein
MEQDKPGRGDSVYQRMGGESASQRATPDEDVEGHKFQPSSATQRATPDDDVEGHKSQRATPDEDVEGHKSQR